jgi:hypothetical protein
LLLDRYLSAATARTLIVIGLNGTGAALPRHELIARIRTQLTGELGFAPEQVRIDGLAVLQGNALRTLLRMQLIAVALACVALALLVLLRFRSPLLALVALVPSLCTAAVVSGALGWLGVPLGTVTVAFAALAVASCAASTLHHLWGVGAELRAGADRATALQRCSAGTAAVLCYIPLGIGAPFLLLAAADFRPSAHFGLLCVVALTAASGCVALLLPPLLQWSGLPACRRPPTVDDDFHPADA